MTVEERYERIEQITAGMAEDRRRDREEYKALWRDLAAKHESLTRTVETLAIDTRLRFEQVADRIEELRARIEQNAAESRAAGRRLEGRIESLVSAMGDFIAKQTKQ